VVSGNEPILMVYTLRELIVLHICCTYLLLSLHLKLLLQGNNLSVFLCILPFKILPLKQGRLSSSTFLTKVLNILFDLK